MTVLYVTHPGAEVRKQKARLQVQWRGETLAALPLRQVERVVLLGPGQVSAAAARALLAASTPVVFCSTRGRYYGMLSVGHEDTQFLLAQVDRHRDQAYRLETAKAIVGAKIRHSRALLRRYVRNHPNHQVEYLADRLEPLLAHLEKACSMPEVMGLEGSAGALYFAAYGRCFHDEEVRFRRRTRHPPRDPANALLSLGYMLVLTEVAGALAAQGFHLGLGFLHEFSARRFALPLDVLEIFRQPVVDRLTLSLFNRRAFAISAFETSADKKVLLKERELRRYLWFFERAMSTPFRDSRNGRTVTLRSLIQQEARALRTAMEAGAVWSPATLAL